MSKKDYVYAFYHIPKSAGSTFRYHILKYLKPDERLYLGAEDLGLWSDKGANPEDLQNAVDKKIKLLSKKERSKVKVVFGHEVTYGLQKYFSRPMRYFTFFRDPIKRTVSRYNHYRQEYFDFKKKGKDLSEHEKVFLVNGRVPEFTEWLDKKYNKKGGNSIFAMYKRLWLNGFLQDKDNIDAKRLLKKFWFVGLVNNFDEESLYLYNKIGIKAFFINQNISNKHFKLSENPDLKEKIIARNKRDIMIYKSAKIYHDKTLSKLNDYEQILKSMKIKKKLLLPFTQAYYAPKDTLKLIFN